MSGKKKVNDCTTCYWDAGFKGVTLKATEEYKAAGRPCASCGDTNHWQDKNTYRPAASTPPPAPTGAAEAPASILMPTDAAERKRIPLYSGLMAYFPDALLCVARVSYIGNEQHHPGTPLHWDKSKSQDEPDALLRHMIGEEWDTVAWRALANLQRKIEAGWRPAWAKNEKGGAS